MWYINILPFEISIFSNKDIRTFTFTRCWLLNENVLSKRENLFPISLMSTSFGDKRKRRAAKSPSFVLTENDKYLIWFGWYVGFAGEIFCLILCLLTQQLSRMFPSFYENVCTDNSRAQQLFIVWEYAVVSL